MLYLAGDYKALVWHEKQGEADGRLFLSYADEVPVAPGDVLIRQYDSDRVIYVLSEGEFEVSMAERPDADPKPIAVIKPVAIVGEQTFLDQEPRTATLTATSAGVVHRLTLSAFDKLRQEEPEIASAFLFDVARSLSLRQRAVLKKLEAS